MKTNLPLEKFANVIGGFSHEDLEELVNASETLALNSDEKPIPKAPPPAKQEIPMEVSTQPVIPITLEKKMDTDVSPDDVEEPSSISRSEMVQRAVDCLFENFALISLNLDFLGDFGHNMTPMGYYLQKIGKHAFLVKESSALSLASLMPMMDKIRSGLASHSTIQMPLVYRRNLEGATIRALVVTEMEIKEIMRCYPELSFGYAEYEGSIDSIKLIVRRRGERNGI